MNWIIAIIKGILYYMLGELAFYAVIGGLIWLWVEVEPVVLPWLQSL